MRLENCKIKTEKIRNTWRLNNMLLKKKWVCEEIKEIKKYLEANENENAMIQNLYDETKAVQEGKSIIIQACLRKSENLKYTTKSYSRSN